MKTTGLTFDKAMSFQEAVKYLKKYGGVIQRQNSLICLRMADDRCFCFFMKGNNDTEEITRAIYTAADIEATDWIAVEEENQ